MIAALKRLFGANGASSNDVRYSKSLAKSRLSFVLIQDRTGLTQEEISNFKKEMVAVIEKYFVIDETGLDVSYKRETESTTLVINSPVVVKRQEGFKHRVGSKHNGANGHDAKSNEFLKANGSERTESKMDENSTTAENIPDQAIANVAPESALPKPALAEMSSSEDMTLEKQAVGS